MTPYSFMACIAVASALFSAGVAPAQESASKLSAADTAKAFGARESVQQASLSPDGRQIAYITPLPGSASAVVVHGMGKAPALVLRSSGDPEKLRSCHWSTNTRLICGFRVIADNGTGPLAFTRVVSLNSDGTDLQMVTARTNSRSMGYLQNGGSVIDWLGAEEGGSVLMTRDFLPEFQTGSLVASKKEGLGVERVDTTTLKREIVEQPREAALEYISDGLGTIRLIGLMPETSSGYMSGRINYSYRTADSREWKPFSTLTFGEDGGMIGFNPYTVDRALNVVYGFDDKNGRRALYKISLDGSMKADLAIARPDVDVDDLITIGRRNRVVGVSYATDRRQIEFFDPELKTLGAALSKAIPQLPLITFVDASADENILLLLASSDVDPGRFYLFDKKTRRLSEELGARPQLSDVALANVKAISFKAADGTEIPGYLTVPVGSSGKNLPAIVMPHGGPSARDEWGFDWLVQFFAARGFAVLQPNFRGSAGYGNEWFQKNGFQSWRTAIGDVNDGGRWLISEGIAVPDKLAIFGWSYGGYAALQSSVLDPELFKAIVAVAPVTDLDMLREESRRFTNFRLVSAFIGTGPHVREGSPAQNVERIKAPVLLFHGDKDMNVGVRESRVMASRLKSAGKSAAYIEFKNLDHNLDDNAARTEMLAKSDEFLRASLGL